MEKDHTDNIRAGMRSNRPSDPRFQPTGLRCAARAAADVPVVGREYTHPRMTFYNLESEK